MKFGKLLFVFVSVVLVLSSSNSFAVMNSDGEIIDSTCKKAVFICDSQTCWWNYNDGNTGVSEVLPEELLNRTNPPVVWMDSLGYVLRPLHFEGKAPGILVGCVEAEGHGLCCPHNQEAVFDLEKVISNVGGEGFEWECRPEQRVIEVNYLGDGFPSTVRKSWPKEPSNTP